MNGIRWTNQLFLAEDMESPFTSAPAIPYFCILRPLFCIYRQLFTESKSTSHIYVCSKVILNSVYTRHFVRLYMTKSGGVTGTQALLCGYIANSRRFASRVAWVLCCFAGIQLSVARVDCCFAWLHLSVARVPCLFAWPSFSFARVDRLFAGIHLSFVRIEHASRWL